MWRLLQLRLLRRPLPQIVAMPATRLHANIAYATTTKLRTRQARVYFDRSGMFFVLLAWTMPPRRRQHAAQFHTRVIGDADVG